MRKRKLFALVTSFTLMASVFAGCGKDGGAETTEPPKTTASTEAPASAEATQATDSTTDTTVAAAPSSESTTAAGTTEPTTAADNGGSDAADTEGAIDGRTYTNDFYNFKITAPENWAYLSHEDTLSLMYQSMSSSFESIDAFKDMLKQSGSDYLLYAYLETGDAKGNVPNIIAQSLPVANIGDYTLSEVVDQTLANTKLQYEQNGGRTDITAPISKDMNGNEFVTASSKSAISASAQDGSTIEVQVNQNYAAFRTDSHVIMMVITYYTDAEAAAAQEVIDSISFLK